MSDNAIPSAPEAQRVATESGIDKVADRIEMVSMGLGIAAGVAAAGAVVAAPTGITALAVAVGVISAPAVVVLAPIIGGAATVVGAASGTVYFYSKWKRRKMRGANEKLPGSAAPAESEHIAMRGEARD